MWTAWLLIPFAAAAASLKPFDHSHALWGQVLDRHLRGGLVDYQALKQSPETLNQYLDQLAAVPEARFMAFSEDQKVAFLANLYNATTLKLIIDHYPLKSIKDIGNRLRGPWDQKIVRLMGRDFSLDDLEHGIIRRNHLDPKIHFALVCAAISCPPLRAEPYVPERLQEQLIDQGKIFLGDPTKNRVDETQQTLYLSKIFEWFAKDIKRESPSVEEFILPFLPEATATRLRAAKFKTKFLEYDWRLNEAPPTASGVK